MERGRISNNNTIMEKVEGNKHQKMIVATTATIIMVAAILPQPTNDYKPFFLLIFL
jgi:hypothetical protein